MQRGKNFSQVVLKYTIILRHTISPTESELESDKIQGRPIWLNEQEYIYAN